MESRKSDSLLLGMIGVLGGLLVLALLGVVGLVAISPLHVLFERAVNGLFAIDTVQALWYVTRSAGIIAYLLLWLSTAWGLAVTSKIFDPLFERAFTYDMHQFISLLAIGFTVVHVVVLLADRYLPFSIAQVLIPFIAPYRPVWVGVGIIGLYLTLLVTVTFYLRQSIGQRAFRMIHYASFAGYFAVTLHGLLAGTDSALPVMQFVYAGTALVVVFLTVYWLAMLLFKRTSTQNAPRVF